MLHIALMIIAWWLGANAAFLVLRIVRCHGRPRR